MVVDISKQTGKAVKYTFRYLIKTVLQIKVLVIYPGNCVGCIAKISSEREVILFESAKTVMFRVMLAKPIFFT